MIYFTCVVFTHFGRILISYIISHMFFVFFLFFLKYIISIFIVMRITTGHEEKLQE